MESIVWPLHDMRYYHKCVSSVQNRVTSMTAKLHMIFQNSYSGRNLVEFQLNILSFSCIFIDENACNGQRFVASFGLQPKYLIHFRSVCCTPLIYSPYTVHSPLQWRQMASQITAVMIVYSTVCSGADHTKHQSSASLACVRGIHRWPVNSPHKSPVTRKMFLFYNDVMQRHRYNATFIPGIVQTPATSSKWSIMVATIRWI